MRLLLDTHALLWWWFDDPRLSRPARDAIADPANAPLVSAASAWEVATKYRLGKLPEAAEAATRFSELVREARMQPLPIRLEHALHAGAYPQRHRDPFDRMLAAQAEVEGIRLVTVDPVFQEFPARILW